MIKVLFVCHGNICRSPMAEFMLKEEVRNLGIHHDFFIDSKAVSNEEIGNDMHYGAKRCLDDHGIFYTRRKASRVTLEDYDQFDYIFLMDQSNMRWMKYIIKNDPEHKIRLFLKDRDIQDPWWTDNFELTYRDLKEGIQLFIEELKKEGKI